MRSGRGSDPTYGRRPFARCDPSRARKILLDKFYFFAMRSGRYDRGRIILYLFPVVKHFFMKIFSENFHAVGWSYGLYHPGGVLSRGKRSKKNSPLIILPGRKFVKHFFMKIFSEIFRKFSETVPFGNKITNF